MLPRPKMTGGYCGGTPQGDGQKDGKRAMKTLFRTLKTEFAPAILIVLAAAASSARAQHEGHEGHEHLGTVHFETSCNEMAQQQFDRGMKYQHSFWYRESKK